MFICFNCLDVKPDFVDSLLNVCQTASMVVMRASTVVNNSRIYCSIVVGTDRSSSEKEY
jgi:hypothetical protein